MEPHDYSNARNYVDTSLKRVPPSLAGCFAWGVSAWVFLRISSICLELTYQDLVQTGIGTRPNLNTYRA